MKSLLPNNSTSLELALEKAVAHIGDIEVNFQDLWSPDRCPEHLLPWLAWSVSVDTWDDKWPESIKRKVISTILSTHSIKGTKAALLKYLEALSINVNLVEWWENGGQPYTFELTLLARQKLNTDSNTLLDEHFYLTVRQAIEKLKRACTGYTLKVGAAAGNQIQVGTHLTAASKTFIQAEFKPLHVKKRSHLRVVCLVRVRQLSTASLIREVA